MPHLAPSPSRSRIVYPDSDGQPMAETDLHVKELLALLETLMHRYRDQRDVYVAGNNFIFYEEGNPKARFSPDVYVVLGAPKKERRSYKLWEEKLPPTVVFEVTSRATQDEDTGKKKARCARLGVEEYFLYDPEGDYLDPALQGFRLDGSVYRRIIPNADGALSSKPLGLKLRLEHSRLRLIDPAGGEPLLRSDEARTRGQLAEERAASAEERAVSAEERAVGAEAENERLRAEIERLKSKRK